MGVWPVKMFGGLETVALTESRVEDVKIYLGSDHKAHNQKWVHQKDSSGWVGKVRETSLIVWTSAKER